MIILGIDPGLNHTGYGLVEIKADKMRSLEYGCITNKINESYLEKIKKIHIEIEKLIKTYSPHEIVLEEIFFSKNTRSAIDVGKVCGAVALTATLLEIDLKMYTPLQVKQAVVGYGRASKAQVQAMVKILLCLDKIPKPDHAADALAVAICHINSKNPYY
ncbi:MAG: crossover junction endodeoxyribonuclease RuvC [Atribacterota bacterium]|nr:crossover junction endodeoxyribonuclease RuvC [Atribacterota bacterium]MDD3641656.1 crossover junction endodeoxyribonuclease RuvC [Atribacterota bacterium]MDD4288618.1 crossover junction endodeoxyribonuclease RuvC [Atribacterota bacterium]MDD4765740.1 crossover junction endodeoxyribonuclease RuvC [Atribacterota bacterium]MDI9596648.1 crossover junction endodeoxyribonuclease RuvC [Atribacterota bacterium]